MKKIISLILAAVTVFAFAACSGNSEDTSGTVNISSEEASFEESKEVSEAESKEESSEEPSVEESSEEPVKEPVTMPEFEEYYSAKVSKNTNKIIITFADTQEENYKTSISFAKKGWGTWNLGQFNVINKKTNRTFNMIPDSTDWEYVYRVGPTQATGQPFCGGNHGNEKLVDIRLFDAKTGEALPSGSIFTVQNVNGVKVVEHTQICFQPGGTAVTNEKTQEFGKPFVNVTRTYIINGVDVYLECDYDFIEDAYFGLSYTTMFCVDKKLGNHILFNQIDGTVKECVTKESGTADGKDYSNNYFNGIPATSLESYGDSDPTLRMHVEVYDAETMCDDFKGEKKTFLWDMNGWQNKVYFSAFDNGGKASKGDHWDTLASWSFYEYVESEGEPSENA